MEWNNVSRKHVTEMIHYSAVGIWKCHIVKISPAYLSGA